VSLRERVAQVPVREHEVDLRRTAELGLALVVAVAQHLVQLGVAALLDPEVIVELEVYGAATAQDVDLAVEARAVGRERNAQTIDEVLPGIGLTGNDHAPDGDAGHLAQVEVG